MFESMLLRTFRTEPGRVPRAGCRRWPRSRPSGFTLVELLVVIAIIAILAALTVPGLQKARAYSRRVQCTSKLQNIGRAVQMFYSDNRAFPNGGGKEEGGGNEYDQYGVPTEGGVFRQILPYLGENNDTLVHEPDVQQVRFAVITELCCPSAPPPDIRINGEVARGDYAFSTGKTAPFGDPCEGPLPPLDGLIVRNADTPVTYEMVPDGMSHTILAGEAFRQSGYVERGIAHRGFGFGWWWPLPGCAPYVNPHYEWATDNLRNLGVPWQPVRQLDVPLTPDEATAFGTWHTAFPVLFGDGAVKWMPKNTDEELLLKLATRNGGEHIDWWRGF